MNVTLEEARTLEAFARNGGIARAAEVLRKANSAVVYSLASIERKTGIRILDRSGYRTLLTEPGKRVLEACSALLQSEQALNNVCRQLADGWEPDLRIVIEGIVPLSHALRAIRRLTDQEIPTRIHVTAEFLSAVEDTFTRTESDIMISVLPPERAALESIRLKAVPASLVAHRDHPLAKRKGKASLEELRRFPILTVRGSDPRLSMSTSAIERASTLQLNDFHSKKSALLSGLGFGWLPNYLMERELKSGELKLVRWTKSSSHLFQPYLYHRGTRVLGPAAREFISAIQA